MGSACTCQCCANTKRYVRLNDSVVLETSEDKRYGAYYFHPLNGIEPVKSDRTEEALPKGERTEHRYATLMRKSSEYAIAAYPRPPEWKIVFENKRTSFCAWEKPGECHLATYRSEGVFAEEVALAFWDPEDKDWDTTVVSASGWGKGLRCAV